MTEPNQTAPLNWMSLFTAIGIMLIGSIYPILLTDSAGKVSHGIAMLYFWSMSAGFVHGVGFKPKMMIWKIVFSGWACFLCLASAILLRF